MAAYAALVSLMNDLELILNHPRHSFSFENKQIISLSQTVDFLIDFLESYDSHGCSPQVLESRIASAAHAAHDVIELRVLSQILAGSTLRGKARSYFLLDLQQVIDSMDFFKRKAVQFKEKNGAKAELPTYSPPTSSKPLNSGKNVTVGLDSVMIRLLDKLTGETCSQRVIPIVGMAGIGKTTLAKNVYEHRLIDQHFDVRLWVTISQECDVETILTQLLSGERTSTGGIVYELGEELWKKLYGRRYLIILDDMWSLEGWEEIQMFFPDSGNGSHIIITTRISNLAIHLNSPPFEMNLLDEDKSWELFCAKAFGAEDCPVELEKTGRAIVKRCQGLPLSIVVIGGHLRKSSRAIVHWEKVANLMNPILSLAEDEQCLKIVSLSYHHLPVCLKPCFLYMGIYGEDHRVYASEVVGFWIAEGFLKPKDGLTLEEVGENYLKDLIDRSLVFVRERRWDGKAKICGIHDTVRELCLMVARKEKFVCVIGATATQDIDENRRVVFPESKYLPDINVPVELSPLLRTIIRPVEQKSLYPLSSDFILLRLSSSIHDVFSEEDGGCFPAAIFMQVNLRYLALYRLFPYLESQSLYISSSLALLWNLQKLIIQRAYLPSAAPAPSEIWEMAQLRHLEFGRIYLPDGGISERAVFRNLHTLVGVFDFKLTEEVCNRMPNIKDLYLFYSHFPSHCQPCSYYHPHNLGRFSKLESLVCSFGGQDSKWRHFVQMFKFPKSVKELTLVNSQLHWEDLTAVIKSLPHLGSLELHSIQGDEWSLVDEEFPSLKILKIHNCDLAHWNAGSSHFPVLEILDIWMVPKLSEIPFDFGEIPTLEHIKLSLCSVSAAISAVRIQMEQVSNGDEDLQLHVDFHEWKEVEGFVKEAREEDLRSNSLRLSYKLRNIPSFLLFNPIN